MAGIPYTDRVHGGRVLAVALEAWRGRGDGLVLALPRGGVPVAWEVALALDLELDLMLVRKLGVPGEEELAMGAIATGGALVVNAQVVAQLRIRPDVLEAVRRRESVELERRARAWRGSRATPVIQGRSVILVDDGLATGASMRVAVAAVRQHHPAAVVVAVPVAPPATVAALAEEANTVVCPLQPEPFMGVGRWYRDFRQVADDEVRAVLRRAWSREAPRDDGLGLS